jgi:hypothetical protein
MGSGHLAVGLFAKRFAPTVSLGTLVLASLFVDILSCLTLLVGVEHSHVDTSVEGVFPMVITFYPYSHSLVAAVLWTAVFAGGFFLATRRAPAPPDRRVLLVIAALVFSHWLLDVASHRPDVPVLLDGPFLGLGLWRSLWATLLVEGGIVAIGIGTYTAITGARDRAGWIGLAALSALLVGGLGFYLGPPPPSATMFAVVNLPMAAIVVWLAAYTDRHRAVTRPQSAA